MSYLYLSIVKKAAEYSGIPDYECAAYILKLMLELRSNSEILLGLVEKPGCIKNYKPVIRKFINLIQGFILLNYHNEFIRFCHRNEISTFNTDLEFDKKAAVYARFIFIIFLREEVKLRPPIKIVP